MSCHAKILFSLVHHVEVNPHQNILLQEFRDKCDHQNQDPDSDGDSYKTLRCIVHDAELKPPLILESFGESAAKCVRGENVLTAVLELRKDILKPKEISRSAGGATPGPPHLTQTISPSERRKYMSPPSICDGSAHGSSGERCPGATEPGE